MACHHRRNSYKSVKTSDLIAKQIVMLLHSEPVFFKPFAQSCHFVPVHPCPQLCLLYLCVQGLRW